MTDVRLTALNPADSQVYPVACNDKGELLLEATEATGDLDVQGDLSVSGVANFVDGAAEIQSQGFFVGTGFVSYKMAASSYAIHDDEINWQYSVYYDGTTHIGGYITTVDPSQDTPNIALNADGSATFAGPVKNLGYDSDYGCNVYTDGANQGGLFAKARSTNGLLPAQGSAFAATWDGADVARIRYDGSAAFKGTLDLETAGTSQVTYRKTGVPSGTLCTWNSDVGGTKAEKVRFGCDGSATFKNFIVSSRNFDTIVVPSKPPAGSDCFFAANTTGQVPGGPSKANAVVTGYGTTSTASIGWDGSAIFAGTVTAQNVTFRLSEQAVAEMPAPLIDEGFAVEREIDLLGELIKMKAEIKNLNAFMQKSIQESSETEQ